MLVHAHDLEEIVVVDVRVVDVVVDRGVVDEHVDAAEGVGGRLGAGFSRVGVGDVGLDEQRLTVPVECGHAGRGALGVHLGDHDLRTLVEEASGVREPDALSRPRDDRDLVVEPTHVCALPLLSRTTSSIGR